MSRALLQIVREATRWTDAELGGLLDIPTSTVQAIRVGRCPEKLSPHQRKDLVEELRGFVDDAQEALAEVELRC